MPGLGTVMPQQERDQDPAERQHGYGLHHPSHKRCRPDFWNRETLFSGVEDNSLVQTEARQENEGDRPEGDGGQFSAALWSQQSGRRDPGENAKPEDRRLTAEVVAKFRT